MNLLQESARKRSARANCGDPALPESSSTNRSRSSNCVPTEKVDHTECNPEPVAPCEVASPGASNTTYQEFKEQELWFTREGEKLFPGHPDLVRVYAADKATPRPPSPGYGAAGHDALLLDRGERHGLVVVAEYKFGFKPVPVAAANLQLRAYICMVAELFTAPLYYGAIFQPRTWPQVHSVCYTPDDVARAREELMAIWDGAHGARAKLKASVEACENCRAELVCSARQRVNGQMERMAWRFPEPASALARLAPEKRTDFLDMLDLVASYRKAAREAAKWMLLEDPGAIPRYKVSEGDERRSISDPAKAWEALNGAGVIDAKGFVGCTDVFIGKLGKEIREQALKRGEAMTHKRADELVNELLGELVEKKRNAPGLDRVSGK